MKRQIIFCIALIIVTACGGGSDEADKVIPDLVLSTDSAFEQVLRQHNVPAIAGAYIEQGNIVEQFAIGLRRTGSSASVAINDRWHLGSITKSFTATLTAVLVEQGFLSWDTTISDVFLTNEYASKYASVTIEQLLSNTGGIEASIQNVPNWESFFFKTNPVYEQRSELSSSLLHMNGHTVGSYNYSNGGFVIAGHMLERIMQSEWEPLLEEYVLSQIGIVDLQYGAPTDGFDASQPYGHQLQNGSWQAVNPDDPYSDNPLAMGPAGTISMSLQSLANYTIEHLNGRRGNSQLLSQDSFIRLHQAMAGNDYALGWFTRGTNVYHMGTNTLWYAHVGMDFGTKDIAVIALTNAGGDRGTAVTDNIIDVLLDRNY